MERSSTALDHQELLKTCRTKLALGNTFNAVYVFLKIQHTDKEIISLIIAILDKEDKARRLKAALRLQHRAEKFAGIAGGAFAFIGGMVLLLLSWYFLNKGLEAGYVFFLPAAGVLLGGTFALGGLIKMLVYFLRKPGT